MSEAFLLDIKARGADFTKADLSRTNLERANLVQAVLRDARLDEASLAGSNLTSADLRGARFVGATSRCVSLQCENRWRRFFDGEPPAGGSYGHRFAERVL